MFTFLSSSTYTCSTLLPVNSTTYTQLIRSSYALTLKTPHEIPEVVSGTASACSVKPQQEKSVRDR